jgi:uncharacterized protein (TIGR03437 family)
MQRLVLIVASVSLCLFTHHDWFVQPAQAQADPRYYNIGNPTVSDIWLDPVNGDDANDGSSRSRSLRTLTAAWNRIPNGVTLTTTGYRINILPGDLPCERNCSNYYANRFGSYQFPVIIRAAEGRGTVTIQGGLNIYGVKYLYLIDLNLRAGGALGAFANNVLHLERVDHVLMRGMVIRGGSRGEFQEALKANQCQYLYLEDSDVGTASSAAVDFLAVQYGHAVGNKLHDAGSFGIYLKSGSAYFRIEANEIYDSLFGFSAGEGANLLFMEPPWLHYEVYDIKFINNVLRDLPGSGLIVYGGYNILIANNTLYRTGYNDDPRRAYGLISLLHGIRLCDGPQASCQQLTDQGAWGPNLPGYENYGQVIPNRNVYIYNNLFYNPAPAKTYYGHFVVSGATQRPASFQNLPDILPADENLQIRGNLIWNGPSNHPLGIEDSVWGCQPSNPTCNISQLRADNTFNTVEPQFINAAGNDFHLKLRPDLLNVKTYAIPAFGWDDLVVRPAVPLGNLNNAIERDLDSRSRSSLSLPGAYTGAGAAVVSAANYKSAVAMDSLVAAFGVNLAPTTTAADSSPLPTSLAGTSVTLTDSAGVPRLAPLIVVSPTQINYQIPPGTATGAAIANIDNVNGSSSIAKLQISSVAPGIFAADASGKGLAAASILRVRADGSQRFEPVARFDPSQNRFTAVPIDLGNATDEVFLILYGTGVRRRSSLGVVNASIGGLDSQVLYAGEQGFFVGLDQLNVRLSRNLAGRGEVAVVLTVEGQTANTVLISIL